MYLMVVLLLLLATPASAQTTLMIEWTDNEPAEDGFHVYRGPSCSGPGTLIGTVPAKAGTGGTVRYTDPGPLAPSTQYSYIVRSFKGSSESANSNCITKTTTAAGPTTPPPPGNPQISQVSTSPTGVLYKLSWTASTGATSYGWNAAYNDNTAPQSGSVSGTSVNFTMPYHASGQASPAWTCVTATAGGTPSEGSCLGYTVPAAPPASVNYALAVTKAGTGQGTVTGAGDYPSGTQVTVTQQAAAGSTFTGWSGDCTGTGACTVTMNANKAVTATFTLTPPAGVQPPAVQSNPNSCEVTLTGTPPDSSSGWSARFKMDSGLSFGNTDSTPPFARTKTVAPGTHSYYVEWIKGSAVVQTSPKETKACP